MKKNLNFLFLILIIFTFWSCNNSNGEFQIDAYPFADEEQEEWGLVDLNGKIIVEDAWDYEPSVAVEGVIYVKNKHGLYEFYTAEKKPKQIGGEYVAVTFFSDGWAAVVENGKTITYIDKKGETKLTLDDKIKWAGAFFNGKARVTNVDGKEGVINKKGEYIIEPKYRRITPFEDGFCIAYKFEDDESANYDLFINEKGEIINKIDNEKYQIPYMQSDGLILVKIKDNAQYGYINKKGEIIIELNEDIAKCYDFNDGYATIEEDHEYGLINKKGEIVLRARYESYLFFVNGISFFSDDNLVGYINYKGEEIIEAQFALGLPFYNKNTIVREDNDEYYFINQKGKQVSDEVFEYIPVYNIYNFYNTYETQTVESNTGLDKIIIADWTLKEAEITNIHEVAIEMYNKQIEKLDEQIEDLKSLAENMSDGEEKNIMQEEINNLYSEQTAISIETFKKAINENFTAMEDNFILSIGDNNYYTTSGIDETKGEWYISKDGKTLELLEYGETKEFNIEELTEEKLVIFLESTSEGITMKVKMTFSSN